MTEIKKLKEKSTIDLNKFSSKDVNRQHKVD